jgi:hypothetical protein
LLAVQKHFAATIAHHFAQVDLAYLLLRMQKKNLQSKLQQIRAQPSLN